MVPPKITTIILIHIHQDIHSKVFAFFFATRQLIGPLTINKGRQKIIKELTRSPWGWLCS